MGGAGPSLRVWRAGLAMGLCTVGASTDSNGSESDHEIPSAPCRASRGGEYGARNHALIEAHFSWDGCAGQTVDCYREVARR